MAHPLDGIDEFGTTVKQEEPVPQRRSPSFEAGAHPLTTTSSWVPRPRRPRPRRSATSRSSGSWSGYRPAGCEEGPFGDLQSKLKADFMEIEKVTAQDGELLDTGLWGAPARAPDLHARAAEGSALEGRATIGGHGRGTDGRPAGAPVAIPTTTTTRSTTRRARRRGGVCTWATRPRARDVEEHKHALMKA